MTEIGSVIGLASDWHWIGFQIGNRLAPDWDGIGNGLPQDCRRIGKPSALDGWVVKSCSVRTLRSVHIEFLFPAHVRVGNWNDIRLA